MRKVIYVIVTLLYTFTMSAQQNQELKLDKSSGRTLSDFFSAVSRKSKSGIGIGYQKPSFFDSRNYDNRYASASNLTKNTHHIITIRKTGNNMYYFANKRFIYQTAYKQFQPNYGFRLTVDGVVFVDSVRIDYIEPS